LTEREPTGCEECGSNRITSPRCQRLAIDAKRYGRRVAVSQPFEA
jgi:hypothetical protein